jgi:hypothetical protein
MKDEIELANIFKAFIQAVAGCEKAYEQEDTIVPNTYS